ncbi:MAG: hypothetical protein ACRC1W_01185 [Shewanella sp.]
MKQIIVDVVPYRVNGETIYRETDLRGLGVTQSFVNTTTNITNVTAALAAAVPTKPITQQSDFSKTANVVATGAATVAAIAAVVPGIGTVVAVVAGVVAAAAALLGKVFANSKAKGYAAERGEYEKVNAQIKYENNELDKQYDELSRAINELKNAISSLNGPSEMDSREQQICGLGLCLWKCKDEKKKLRSAKDEYETLKKEQENKTQIMALLLDEYNKLVKGLLELKSRKSTKDWLLWIFGSAVVIGGVYYFIKRSKR